LIALAAETFDGLEQENFAMSHGEEEWKVEVEGEDVIGPRSQPWRAIRAQSLFLGT
jgi:hypothetical protein